MSTLGFIVPVAVLGLIAWIVVGFTRLRGAEPFTLATATALYARVLLIVGVVMSLTGAGVVIKALIGFINVAYSYFDYSISYGKGAPPGFQGPPVASIEQMRSQDLVLGITLIVVGALVAVAHFYLARAVAGRPGGSPAWVTRGTTLALTIVTALGAIPAAAIGIYQMLSYFIVGSSQGQQLWGEPVGTAIAFLPAWLFMMTRLVRELKRPTIGSAAASA
jgi:hypothetical protein